MENYLSINGNKTELTKAQLRELGFACPKSADEYTIAEVSEIVKAGKARDSFALHDIISAAGYELEIIGFDRDCDAEDYAWPTITVMAKALLIERRMHSGACERGWVDTELREWLNSEYFNEMPDELKQFIRTIQKTTHTSDGEPIITEDKLFLPSESEMFGSAVWSNFEDGERYEVFATSADRRRRNDSGEYDWYWTRSLAGSASNFCYVNYYGIPRYSSAAGTAIRVHLCFCI